MSGRGLTGGFPVVAVIHGEILAIAFRGGKVPIFKGQIHGLFQPGTREAMGFLRAVKEKKAVDKIAFVRGSENRLKLAIEKRRAGVAEVIEQITGPANGMTEGIRVGIMVVPDLFPPEKGGLFLKLGFEPLGEQLVQNKDVQKDALVEADLAELMGQDCAGIASSQLAVAAVVALVRIAGLEEIGLADPRGASLTKRS